MMQSTVYITIGLGISGVFCILALACYVFDRRASDDRLLQPTTELSNLSNGQCHRGLDGPTIESYPKIQLGESLEMTERA